MTYEEQAREDQAIVMLTQRIHCLSSEEGQKTEDLFFRLAKIREIANALLPRVEARCELGGER